MCVCHRNGNVFLFFLYCTLETTEMHYNANYDVFIDNITKVKQQIIAKIK